MDAASTLQTGTHTRRSRCMTTNTDDRLIRMLLVSGPNRKGEVCNILEIVYTRK